MDHPIVCGGMTGVGTAELISAVAEAGALGFLNAFTPTMAGEFEWTFTEVNENDDVRAVVVTGAGKAFCAGMDLGSDGNVFGLDESRTPTLASGMPPFYDEWIAATEGD